MRHLPGMPYGPACREFSDALSSEISADCGRIPTLLLGDLNFPEEVLGGVGFRFRFLGFRV